MPDRHEATGFRVTIVDDRPAFAIAERFPEAAATLASPLTAAVEQMPIRKNTYCVVVTRGHKEDAVVLRALAARAQKGELPRFLGMIGSKTKQALLWKHLRQEGVAETFLAVVRTPMGSYIGARSHEEIAVSVVAELIAVRRTGRDQAHTWADRQKSPRLTELRDLPEAQ